MLRKVIKIALLLSVLCFGIVIFSVYHLQSRFIYFPRTYNQNYQSLLPQADRIEYLSEEVEMVAFSYPKGQLNDVPNRVWWLFCGNGSLALDWLPLLGTADIPPGTRYILYDYPSYGDSKGAPHPDSIFRSIESLKTFMSQKWQLPMADINDRSSAMGYSLGASVALRSAATCGYDKVVAISPFTSMDDMAGSKVGWLKFMLKHHYDNRESVRLLFSDSPASELVLFHGEQDSFIPISMSRELQTLAPPDKAILHSVPNAGHDGIIKEWGQKALIEILIQP